MKKKQTPHSFADFDFFGWRENPGFVTGKLLPLGGAGTLLLREADPRMFISDGNDFCFGGGDFDDIIKNKVKWYKI